MQGYRVERMWSTGIREVSSFSVYPKADRGKGPGVRTPSSSKHAYCNSSINQGLLFSKRRVSHCNQSERTLLF